MTDCNQLHAETVLPLRMGIGPRRPLGSGELSTISGSTEAGLLRTLRRIAQRTNDAEYCEFCRAALNDAHRHLLETATRKIICACDPCALRFENVIGRWKLIPRDAHALPGLQISDGQWEALALPINLAFFSISAQRVVVMYPGPAGAIESSLATGSWDSLLAANPSLVELEPDVEALLANRLGSPAEYYFAPIDLCFELVGLIRVHWRGLSGGDRVWREIQDFFQRLRRFSTSDDRQSGRPHEASPPNIKMPPGQEATHA